MNIGYFVSQDQEMIGTDEVEQETNNIYLNFQL